MKYVYLGKIVNTHGIKGEVRILSNFDKKELVFKNGFSIYIGNDYQKEIINSYRHHKEYDMVTFYGINNINDVLKYKGLSAYINYNDLNLNDDDYILDDLIGFKIISDEKNYGEVMNIVRQKNNILLHIRFEKNYYIPYNSSYIKKVDLKNLQINVLNAKDLIL